MKYKVGDKVVILDVPKMYGFSPEEDWNEVSPSWNSLMSHEINKVGVIQSIQEDTRKVRVIGFDSWLYHEDWIMPHRSMGTLEGVLTDVL